MTNTNHYLKLLSLPGVAEDESRLTRLPTDRGSCSRLSPLVPITRAGIAYTCSVEPEAPAPAGVEADEAAGEVTHGGKTGSGT